MPHLGSLGAARPDSKGIAITAGPQIGVAFRF
jgi:hypothetical protein